MAAGRLRSVFARFMPDVVIRAAAREGATERVAAPLREAVPWDDAVDVDAWAPGVPAS